MAPIHLAGSTEITLKRDLNIQENEVNRTRILLLLLLTAVFVHGCSAAVQTESLQTKDEIDLSQYQYIFIGYIAFSEADWKGFESDPKANRIRSSEILKDHRLKAGGFT